MTELNCLHKLYSQPLNVLIALTNTGKIKNELPLYPQLSRGYNTVLRKK